MPTILPDLSFEEAIEVTKIYSILGLTKTEEPLITARPFRNPHHTVTPKSLVGGGTNPRPRRNKFST